MSNVFDKLADKNELPIATGSNVFLATEFQAHIGLSSGHTRARLRTLAAQGKVRKVRTRRDGKTVPAWQYIGANRRKVTAK